MDRLSRNMWISFVLGIVALGAIGLSFLALADIFHGEEDLSTEWSVVRFSFAVILIFDVFAVITLFRVLRAKRD
jgi:uncharacterized BrkB/YihY/UPF0761 family membrane protein